ncbi:DUF4331 family protein [Aquimarina agarivorans]|uniref:DUF4331 family protein n=1 Tax=Aquimarina agarivorans TaxID=980584 RepID=UPI000248F283|nr:DUF4331 family protein [Aquimarina agarivorans]
MKKLKNYIIGAVALSVGAALLISSDHVDAPSVLNTTADVADFYAFENNTRENMVFIVTSQGILSPQESENANFDQNVLFEINIDNTGDNVEDLVIQMIRRGDQMHFFGPVIPNNTGLSGSIVSDASIQESVRITPYQDEDIILKNASGISYFAGVTDDPFFFDIARFRQIIAGQATGFLNPGNDTWNGLNVLTLAIELPKTLLGTSDTINAWVTANRKQN